MYGKLRGRDKSKGSWRAMGRQRPRRAASASAATYDARSAAPTNGGGSVAAPAELGASVDFAAGECVLLHGEALHERDDIPRGAELKHIFVQALPLAHVSLDELHAFGGGQLLLLRHLAWLGLGLGATARAWVRVRLT